MLLCACTIQFILKRCVALKFLSLVFDKSRILPNLHFNIFIIKCI